MSWNPCPGFHGAAYDRRENRERKYKDILNELMQTNPPKFDQINRLSKYWYLYWKVSIEERSYKIPFNDYVMPYYMALFNRNKNLVYKPAQKHLTP